MSLYIFDMDGVIYRGKKVLPGAKRSLTLLKRRKEEVCFLSNNSTLSRWGHQKRLYRMGIEVSLEDLFPSSYLAAIYFSMDKQRMKGKVFIIGEEGLFEELRTAGIPITSRIGEVDSVVVGMDRGLSFEKLTLAHQAITRGAKFIATNMDLTYPVENGTLPGAGPIVKALEASTGKTPFLLGKPEVFGLNMVMQSKEYSPQDTLFIGDQLETDILAGKRAGVTTILVFSGVTGGDKLKHAPASLKPDYTISSLEELPSLQLSLAGRLRKS